MSSVEKHLNDRADILRFFNLRKMFCVGNRAGLDRWVALRIFFCDQIDIRLRFTAENIDAVVDLFQSFCDVTFRVITLDAGVDRLRRVAKMGGLIIFVEVVRIYIVRIVEVVLGECFGDDTSRRCKIVEQSSDDREIEDQLVTFCRFSRYMAAGEE